MKKIIPIFLMALMMGCQHDKAEDTSPATEPALSTNPQNTAAPTENRPPIAEAGDTLDVGIYSRVVLNGQNSSDPDNDKLTFEWSFLSMPEGSVAELETLPSSPTTSFTPDVTGVYLVQLVVTDEHNESSIDVAKVSAGFSITNFEALFREYDEKVKKSEYETEQDYLDRVIPFFDSEPIRFFRFRASESYDVDNEKVTIYAGDYNIETTDDLYGGGTQIGFYIYGGREALIPSDGFLHVVLPDSESFEPVDDPDSPFKTTVAVATLDMAPDYGLYLDGEYEVVIGVKFRHREGMLDAGLGYCSACGKNGGSLVVLENHLVGDLKRILIYNGYSKRFLYDQEY